MRCRGQLFEPLDQSGHARAPRPPQTPLAGYVASPWSESMLPPRCPALAASTGGEKTHLTAVVVVDRVVVWLGVWACHLVAKDSVEPTARHRDLASGGPSRPTRTPSPSRVGWPRQFSVRSACAGCLGRTLAFCRVLAAGAARPQAAASCPARRGGRAQSVRAGRRAGWLQAAVSVPMARGSTATGWWRSDRVPGAGETSGGALAPRPAL